MKIDLDKYNTNEKLTEYFLKIFSNNSTPISVSFRDILPNLNTISKYPHLIHSYPAKLIAHIPHFFINNNIFSKEEDLILDPFCGSGTVLLESLIAKRNSIGADANPLARLITKVKTTYIDKSILNKHLINIINKFESISNPSIPNIVNKDYWFPLKNQIKLGRLRDAIFNTTENEIREFFLVCFSNLVKKASYSDPRISVPVRLNASRYPESSINYNKTYDKINQIENLDIISSFIKLCKYNIKSIDSLKDFHNRYNAKVVSKDARLITKNLNSNIILEDNSVDLIITSPPYAGAQKYIRSSSLNIGWLGMAEPWELKLLDKKNIGRENYIKSELKEIYTGINSADKLIKEVYKKNKLRSTIISNYLIEMTEALMESKRVLKNGSYLIIVIGNNRVIDIEFNTQDYLTEYLLSHNFELKFKLIDDIKSYGLMTKRNKTADIISREWILVFQNNK